ncbi:hypothetical protein [Sporohalobacter salinus]|uniref:hypothetical protein n=1 Tax=Sporohalobacter salinus TaxID=1494606 RepID=UPI001960BF20|nr:hypothetical protein [Sporohalobacter salinus]MBM7623745.1 hypothetical protein [Sporohalobacter salinus]
MNNNLEKLLNAGSAWVWTKVIWNIVGLLLSAGLFYLALLLFNKLHVLSNNF